MTGVTVQQRGFLERTGWSSFGEMPPWVLLPQLFLAAGWLRAGIANATTGGWWSGAGVREFIAVDTGHAVDVYAPFLTHVVEPLAVAVAITVCVAEVAVGSLLVLNRWTVGTLLSGAFLNLHFMLAGAVNPSAFYLVIAMVIVLWRVESGDGAVRRSIARRTATAAAVTTVGLTPFVTTVRPAQVIEDPAIVLIFLSLLLATTTRWARL
jgi:thiosulfate dehydrogenase [quinone] large subunit